MVDRRALMLMLAALMHTVCRIYFGVIVAISEHTLNTRANDTATNARRHEETATHTKKTIHFSQNIINMH